MINAKIIIIIKIMLFNFTRSSNSAEGAKQVLGLITVDGPLYWVRHGNIFGTIFVCTDDTSSIQGVV